MLRLLVGKVGRFASEETVGLLRLTLFLGPYVSCIGLIIIFKLGVLHVCAFIAGLISRDSDGRHVSLPRTARTPTDVAPYNVAPHSAT